MQHLKEFTVPAQLAFNKIQLPDQILPFFIVLWYSKMFQVQFTGFQEHTHTPYTHLCKVYFVRLTVNPVIPLLHTHNNYQINNYINSLLSNIIK